VKNTAEAGWNISANGNNQTNVGPNGISNEVDLQSAGSNIEITKTGSSNDIIFGLADDISLNSITTGTTVMNNDGITLGTGSNPVKLTDSGLDNGGNKITHVADGTDDHDAVNFGQLQGVKDTANEGWNLTDNSGQHQSNIGPGDTVDLANSDGNIKIDNNNGDVSFDLTDQVTIGSSNPVTIDGDNGVVTGLTNTSLPSDLSTMEADQAASQGQLADLGARGLDFVGDNAGTTV